jgi:hypothetical protein
MLKITPRAVKEGISALNISIEHEFGYCDFVTI